MRDRHAVDPDLLPARVDLRPQFGDCFPIHLDAPVGYQLFALATAAQARSGQYFL